MATTYYTWDRYSDNVLMESDENGVTTAEYTNEPGQYGKLVSQHRDGATSYHHYDGQGSTRQLTDETGSVTDTATYTAFGETVAKTGSTTNPFGYKGAVGYYANPETEDIYVRARTYMPAIARWMSVDPLGFVDGLNLFAYVKSVDPLGVVSNVNLFEYVKNNPTYLHDASGLMACLGDSDSESDLSTLIGDIDTNLQTFASWFDNARRDCGQPVAVNRRHLNDRFDSRSECSPGYFAYVSRTWRYCVKCSSNACFVEPEVPGEFDVNSLLSTALECMPYDSSPVYHGIPRPNRRPPHYGFRCTCKWPISSFGDAAGSYSASPNMIGD